MWDLFALLFSSACAYGVERKRALKVREMAEVEEVELVNIWSVRKQTVAKGQMSRVRKGL